MITSHKIEIPIIHCYDDIGRNMKISKPVADAFGISDGGSFLNTRSCDLAHLMQSEYEEKTIDFIVKVRHKDRRINFYFFALGVLSSTLFFLILNQ